MGEGGRGTGGGARAPSRPSPSHTRPRTPPFFFSSDLKPENFLLSSKDASATLKATDFGLSSFFRPGQVFTDIVGSAYYVAPEVLKRSYSKEADIWSCGETGGGREGRRRAVSPFLFARQLARGAGGDNRGWAQPPAAREEAAETRGSARQRLCFFLRPPAHPPTLPPSSGVILYILLSGVPPFWGETEQQIFDCILKGDLDLASDPWPAISDSAKDCVRRMLTADPKKRASADQAREGMGMERTRRAVVAHPSNPLASHQILAHEWMKVNGTASNKPMDNVVLARMRGFAGMNKLKKEALKVIATGMSPEEIAGLKALFESLDTDKSGSITVDELRDGLARQGSAVAACELKALLAALDADSTGTIDYPEFLAATLHASQLEREDNLMRAFARFDADGSGTISKEELIEALKESGATIADVDTIVAEADADGDGTIDYQEFCAMMLGRAMKASGAVAPRKGYL